MAKKRKAFNPTKQLQRVGDHLVNNKLVCYTDDLKGCVVVDLKHSRIVPPQSREGRQVIAALSRPHTWSCYIAAFGRSGFEEYMKSEFIKTETRYYQADLAPIFEEHHSALIRGMNPTHLCGVGWIADPKGGELTEEEAHNVFSMLGVWRD